MLAGIDLSSHNPEPIDWLRVAARAQFALLKCTEGTGYVDPFLAERWQRARGAGLVVGAYHFARPSLNAPEAEADYFLRLLPLLLPGDLVALDIEEAGTTGDRSAWALTWLARVAARVGCRPLKYSYPDYAARWLAAPALADYPSWFACYGGTPPASGPWAAPAILQYTDAGSVPGIAGPVDLSRCALSLAELRALGKPAPLTPAAAWHVTVPGTLKTQPNHASEPVLDAAGEPVVLDQGTDVAPLGDIHVDAATGERWERIRVIAPQARGWFLAARLGPGV